MSGRVGYRGYIGSRPLFGSRIPQHLQNLAVRDYCQRRGLNFLLSATEYVMPGCYMMLAQVIDEIDRLEGIVCFSLFMLPGRDARRQAIYDRVLAAGASLHGALENIAIRDADDVRRFEDLWLTKTFVEGR